MAEDDHIAFAETLLRDLSLSEVSEAEIGIRSLARIRVVSPLRLVAMHGKNLHAHGADGIHYRARHDDSGLSIALLERAKAKVAKVESTELLDPSLAQT